MAQLIRFDQVRKGDVIVSPLGLIGTVLSIDGAWPSGQVFEIALGAGDMTGESHREAVQDISTSDSDEVLLLYRPAESY
jgi:preprotein translocase subunit YajC